MLNRLPQMKAIDAERDDDDFDLRDTLNFLWRQWRFIAAIVAVAILIGAVQLARSTPMYSATAQVLLDPRRLKAPGEEMILDQEVLNAPAFESQMAIVRSTTLLRRVVEREQLVPKEPAKTDASADANHAQPQAESGLRRLLSIWRDGRGNAQVSDPEYPPDVLKAIAFE